MTKQEMGSVTQLTLPMMGEDMKSHRDPDHDFPEQLMTWLSCKAVEGSTYITLAADCDGRQGTLVLTSHDEDGHCMAEEIYKLHAVEYLLAT